jgi:hypothetical protein
LSEIGRTNQVFVFDNVAFHKCVEIQEKITNAGHRLKFLPPYSPFLNPIENLFSKWKQLVRTANCNNEVELLNVIDEVYSDITTVDCEGFYRHMLTFLPRCISREEIFGD